jgi:hypothetical protein
MQSRKLRIAWSLAWGILTLLLIASWVRSYWRVEHILWNSPTACYGISIYPGETTIEFTNGGVLMPMGWSHVVFPHSGHDVPADDEPKTTFGFAWNTDDDQTTAYVPFWFLTLICTAFAWFGMVLPPTVKRFSLRTLLIAITLIAVVLGAVVYLSKSPTTPPTDVGDFGRPID